MWFVPTKMRHNVMTCTLKHFLFASFIRFVVMATSSFRALHCWSFKVYLVLKHLRYMNLCGDGFWEKSSDSIYRPTAGAGTYVKMESYDSGRELGYMEKMKAIKAQNKPSCASLPSVVVKITYGWGHHFVRSSRTNVPYIDIYRDQWRVCMQSGEYDRIPSFHGPNGHSSNIREICILARAQCGNKDPYRMIKDNQFPLMQ